MSLCSWNDSHGTTCKWPGPFSSDTHGGGRYYCVWHWRAFGLDRLEMKSEGDRIVRDSYEWDGSQESYLALRAEAAKKVSKPVAHASQDSQVNWNDGIGVSRMDRLPKKISQLVPDLQPAHEDF